jgi:hypothetical protein
MHLYVDCMEFLRPFDVYFGTSRLFCAIRYFNAKHEDEGDDMLKGYLLELQNQRVMGDEEPEDPSKANPSWWAMSSSWKKLQGALTAHLDTAVTPELLRHCVVQKGKMIII